MWEMIVEWTLDSWNKNIELSFIWKLCNAQVLSSLWGRGVLTADKMFPFHRSISCPCQQKWMQKFWVVETGIFCSLVQELKGKNKREKVIYESLLISRLCSLVYLCNSLIYVQVAITVFEPSVMLKWLDFRELLYPLSFLSSITQAPNLPQGLCEGSRVKQLSLMVKVFSIEGFMLNTRGETKGQRLGSDMWNKSVIQLLSWAAFEIAPAFSQNQEYCCFANSKIFYEMKFINGWEVFRQHCDE